MINDHINNLMGTHVPTKMSQSSKHCPWLTNSVKHMCRKKQLLYNLARRTYKCHHWKKCRSHKRSTLKALRQACWSYIDNILQLSLDSKDLKPFWRFSKSQRQDSVNVSALTHEGWLYSNSKSIAELLNSQFKSIFMRKYTENIDKSYGPNYPTIDPLIINPKGVEKLLSQLNPSKASRPVQIPCHILKGFSEELAPVFSALFKQSLDTSRLPSLWSQAYAKPVFKKGQWCMPGNYRPVSLTCVSCKLFEHILCKHIRNNLDLHGILTPLNHGFKSKHSCETQLLLTVQDLMTYTHTHIYIYI